MRGESPSRFACWVRDRSKSGVDESLSDAVCWKVPYSRVGNEKLIGSVQTMIHPSRCESPFTTDDPSEGASSLVEAAVSRTFPTMYRLLHFFNPADSSSTAQLISDVQLSPSWRVSPSPSVALQATRYLLTPKQRKRVLTESGPDAAGAKNCPQTGRSSH
jgi:hypothetical protein